MAKGIKTGGREAGTQNKFTVEAKERINNILQQHFTPEKINDDLKEMEAKDRLQFLLKLLDFTTPKMKQSEINANIVNETQPPIVINYEGKPISLKT